MFLRNGVRTNTDTQLRTLINLNLLYSFIEQEQRYLSIDLQLLLEDNYES